MNNSKTCRPALWILAPAAFFLCWLPHVQARWTYYGTGIGSSFVNARPTPFRYQIKIQSLKASRNMEIPKLRLSMEQKLPRIKACYDHTSWQQIWKKYHLWKTGNMSKQEAQHPPKKDEEIRTLDIVLALNAYGRATHTQIKAGDMPTSLQHCFLWYLQGRKFFPAEGNRPVSVQSKLEVRLMPSEPAVGTVTSPAVKDTTPMRSRSRWPHRKLYRLPPPSKRPYPRIRPRPLH